MDLDRLKARRRGQRGVVTKFTREAKTLMETELLEDDSLRRLEVISKQLEGKCTLLKALDESILAECPTDEIENEVVEAEELSDKITQLRVEIESVLPSKSSDIRIEEKATKAGGETMSREISETRESIETREPERINRTGAPGDGHSKRESTPLVLPPIRREDEVAICVVKPKLPKLTLPRFSDDITRFRTFWDSFESAVDRNSGLSAIDKFNYLNSLLEGAAAHSIQGLPLSEKSYMAAKEILHERFGKTQTIIAAHMEKLLQVPKCLGDKASHLRLVYDKIHANVRGLEALGVKAEEYGSFLIPVIMAKLSSEVRLQIARVTTRDIWKVDELLQVIKCEVEARELSDTVRVSENRSDSQPGMSRHNRGTTSSFVIREQSSGGRSCLFCKGEHFSASCEVVKDVQARKDVLKRDGRCFVCLAVGHHASQCHSARRCRKCGRRHHQAICESREPRLPEANLVTVPNTEETSTTQTAAYNQGTVLLQMASGFAVNSSNELVPVRVLLDSGSQRSYITLKLKNRLGLIVLKKESVSLNVFGSQSFSRQQCDLVKMKLLGRCQEGIEITALCFPSICSPLNRVVTLGQHPEFQELELADLPHSDDGRRDNGSIDVLIGSDHYWEIVHDEIIRGSGGLVAVSSRLGWLISGPVTGEELDSNVSHTHLAVAIHGPTTLGEHSEGTSGLEQELRRFWETESIGIVEEPVLDLTKEPFPSQIKYDFIEGRYKVGLPWKSARPESSNYNLCVGRLMKLKARLQGREALMMEYDKIFQTQLQTEPVPMSELSSRSAYFLPHHGVIREDKDTTKLRIVFDGSARSEKRHHSINDCLEKGPNLTPLIFDVLLRFRTHRIGITADIEKAFHQIMIELEDRNMLRLLWFDKVQEADPKIVQYRFCRLVFGLTPSPAILQGVIQHHLSRQRSNDPVVIELLSNTLYVDDFPGGASDVEGGYHLYCQSKKKGGFNLRKWRTNDSTLQQMIDRTEGEAAKNIPVSQPAVDKPLKILGLGWNISRDNFCVDFNELIQFVNTLPPTKRSLLRVTAKVYDPFGFISPFTVSFKVIFQQLCTQKVNWDDKLEGSSLVHWMRLSKEFSLLTSIQVPRCLFAKDRSPVRCQLHGFSDASEKAYAAVIFLRIEYSEGDSVDANIVASKARVSPIKKQTIPRLELLGATILARLLNTVQQQLNSLPLDTQSFCWTDSFTTLCWIKNERQWKPYVQNRVEEIRNLTDRDSWRFCPGKDNPADIPSRSCVAEDLVNNDLWWNGPSFLKAPIHQWPNLPTTYDREKAIEELVKKPCAVTHALAVVNHASVVILNLERLLIWRDY